MPVNNSVSNCAAPTPVDARQLQELSIRVVLPPKQTPEKTHG